MKNQKHNHKMNKKAYFFLIDVIFAIIILTVGFLILSSTNVSKEKEIPIKFLSTNLMELFSTVEIRDLCSDINSCICSSDKIEEFCQYNHIENYDQSILDYFGELYYKNEKGKIDELFLDLVENEKLLRRETVGYELRISNEKISPLTSTIQEKDSADTLITSKKIIFGFYENRALGEVDVWGPYLLEIDLWQK